MSVNWRNPQTPRDGRKTSHAADHDRAACSGGSGIDVRPAAPAEVIDLRHRVLREGLPRESAIFSGDEEPTTQHFVATRDRESESESGSDSGSGGSGDDVVGCVTLVRSEWAGEPAWQLRGMAVAPELQRGGVGGRLLERVDQFVAASDARRLWCNARVPAVEFYRRNGWAVASEPFEIPTAGPHVRMVKVLSGDGWGGD